MVYLKHLFKSLILRCWLFSILCEYSVIIFLLLVIFRGIC
ncbi:hypothetical protein HMPREF1376_00083 [Enterococcus faecium R446]|nr:hypothetical protein HMPREF1376_00083 [Enterococcus faecium R446]